uniref:malate synthase n=1 Tax=Culicoides sonorensis TaxID=179676 RepID=A0A336LLQ2_CULSO
MINIDRAPSSRLSEAYRYLFDKDAITFLSDFVTTFEGDYDKIILQRQRQSLSINEGTFSKGFKNVHSNEDWKISPLPECLKNRKLDLGDCSPANTFHFIDALNSNVQGIQVDFDDGFCPTWFNTILGLYNVCLATRSKLNGMLRKIENCPLLMMRPRAFNMIEHHCSINGRKVPGAFFDFALLMYHNARILFESYIGPYFYLSKIESVSEALLWNKIFHWIQDRLNIPQGTIKACILIENIFAAFEMEDILFAIKEHAIGLNCGIWDYSASIIQKFGHQKEYLIPDRSKYVNVGQTFLKNYMQLVIRTCHKHNALATGGMLWRGFTVLSNQLQILPDISHITPDSLLQIPKGEVTLEGLRHNLNVSLLFIYHWLSAQGIFYYKLSVEDSATAEISRSQLWQWLRHEIPIEGIPNCFVDQNLMNDELNREIEIMRKTWCKSEYDRKKLYISKRILIDIITARSPPEFITSYLNDIIHGRIGKCLLGKL